MATVKVWLGVTLVLWAITGCHLEDDFAFDTAQEDAQDSPSSSNVPLSQPTSIPVQRLWGIPDSIAVIGKLFRLRIPQDAFKGDIDHYEAHGAHGSSLPHWLLFDRSSGIFQGVPNLEDVGELYVTVRAVGPNTQDYAKDIFSLEVVHKSSVLPEVLEHKHKMSCKNGEYPTIMYIMLDAQLKDLKPKQRIAAIKNLAGFLGLHYDVFLLRDLKWSKENLRLGKDLLSAGPGNVRGRRGKSAALIQWQVGCGGHISKHHKVLAMRLEQQAGDGTLAEVLQIPVVGWHIKTDSPRRNRREIQAGSGDGPDGLPEYEYEDIDDDEGGDDEDDLESETEAVPELHIVPTMASPAFGEPTSVQHPHRHHHGEDILESGFTDDIESQTSSSTTQRLPTSPILYGTIMSTPVMVPFRPTHLLSSEILIEPTRVYEDYGMITPSATPVFVTEVDSSATSDIPTTQVTEPLPPSSSSGTSVGTIEDVFELANTSSGGGGGSTSSSTSSSTTDLTSPTPEEQTTPPPPPPPTSTSETTGSRIVEEIEYEQKNIPPEIEHRLPRIKATAGKSLRYPIPENTFSDLEDGTTRSLRLIFKGSEGDSVSSDHWVQFNPQLQEVYGLPLEEHVSRWTYVVEAMDKEEKSVSDELEIVVQQHKAYRAVNHEFSVHLHLEKKYDFPSTVDWEMRVLDGLARLFGDPDDSQITVRAINTTRDPYIFTWTNDSLPRTPCPQEELRKMFAILAVNDDGDPSTALKDVLLPSIRVKKVTFKGSLQCENVVIPEIKVTVAPPRDNFPPTFRNQVDHLNATVGVLLVYAVPEDTCYDPEQLHTRNLKLTLLTKHRGAIQPKHWLQFDVKNQEFFGIPSAEDVGRKEYHLVCEDREGNTASDGLEIEVFPAPKIEYSVEFSMKLNISHQNFTHTPKLKRQFIEELCDLLQEQNRSAIILGPITEGSTVVTWYNRSLPTDHCPNEEILRLKRILKRDDEPVLGPAFPISEVNIMPRGICLGGRTLVHVPEAPAPPVDDSHPLGKSTSQEYLTTYIVPAVIIAVLLILAGIVACFLYRRRRTGKLSVGDEDERQSFRNKGIPVIFQDELDEKPEPVNKSPVIMKEEKPPLPPPEYRRDGDCETPPTPAHPLLGDTDDTPYQPPPPVTGNRDSGRQGRPKPTPTYRKPPPYVPP